MTRSQSTALTSYQDLDRFFQLQGAPLLLIVALNASWQLIRACIPLILIQATYQAQTGTAARLARQSLKKEAAARADAARLLLLAYVNNPLHADATLAAAFRASFASKLRHDSAFTRYLTEFLLDLQPIAKPLEDFGFDPADLVTLTTILQTLNTTQGDGRNSDAVAEAATQELEKYFQQAHHELTTQLDLIVHGQALKQPVLVAEYDTLRHPPKPARRPRPATLKGELQPGIPVLLYDRTTAHAVNPTLGNDSGRRLVLRYFTAPTADPATATPDTGLLLKNRKRRPLDDYSQLGDPQNPFVFVVLLGADGPGRYYVRF